ncbi:DNA mismatch repair endonuclease MutL [Haloferax mediterranei ATCC 33500]|uniref:DNA mismatch repair protein MutL n=1 Tax=Haloferax mediterranei (strain ATCC 33500 / DSM 1411 / JCM 8866 / NBRC 14739 / NCIMB 2177 / R-4) TaxID=523841 RepID=I3R1Z1_HALMT|nr:DNA mismatch repair endonuclease MutL [Haloferax mediterranei]AFK18251.1 DNA mismatch repair protein MutL [Haloferax mediterranei ATCC 33500]AHZ22347.1 DNA mismatch repair protein MutL [Haloferax mediterranei ATCC 33500]EMA02477.1 DNA mismatch repair protein MutL [Haloferax mediterranei ATCC 33500]MDX5988340.1 DNA mismatch repair endonuclease MutL [Haloferax mediterranei ATCC 33500]QCQ74774.1 DNA mismatch repair endonuclease MutL [Haloferax mediterranei ATCC 33500]
MTEIYQLDEKTIQRIAAGEVVERPASVVKELFENSLDADATRVSVAVDSGGVEGVRIRDDGVGMSEEDLELAVREHTTSKIGDIEDLEAGIGTLGFRGEALHTIGAVSRMTIRSKPRGGDVGTELRYEGGEVEEVRPAGCPEGTVVEVEDLFYNTPARRKFLKTTATEFDHVNTVVTHYALANPDVAVSLEHDDREVFATEGRDDLQSTVLSVYGREVAESMVSVEHDAPGISVSGLVSHPETTRSTRDYLSTFVNDRYVTDRVLREAVLDAYGGQLDADRYPFAVLFVEVAPDAVDVNVHPRKMEVRWDEEPEVKREVTDAVEDALLNHGLVRSSAPRGRSKADEAAIEPGEPDEADAGTVVESADPHEVHGPADDQGDTERPTARDVQSAREGREERKTREAGKTSSEQSESDTTDSPEPESSTRETTTSATQPSQTSPPPTPPRKYDLAPGPEATEQSSLDTGPAESSASATDSTPATEPSPSTGESESSPPTESTPSQSPSGRISAPTTQRDLSGGEANLTPEFESLPSMRILGQLLDTYIVAETSEGLVLVDQHAADERVNYERLKNEVEGDTPTQALAEPVELELTAREAALFEEYREALAQVGFHAGRTGERTVSVRTVPAVFDAALDPGLLRDALTAFVREEADGGQKTVDAVADELLADLACYPSITGNTSLREGSVLDLLSALDDCENPYACPHGRPVVIEFDRDEIESRFERDYPGHGGRRAEE